MQIISRNRHAIMIMLYLARHPGRAASTTEIGAELGISVSYLEQLFTVLRRDGLVRSVRGPGGGYLLVKPADEITVAELFVPFRKDADAKHELSAASAEFVALWAQFCQQANQFFSTLTLAQIAGVASADGRLPHPAGG
ncbi:RrF2 family transcriptional regulator [Serratia rubidaea]|uniref:RrF2 family transcriptional regulator n=1 Tax=Serratia rubidaea TaxID=61652 RepID=UPI0022B88AF6|nr:Rrf2 family transcriptional regulator [Serratia rubidaea]WBF46133.1 Rrf2 family transcriptional regulator [Serratia rubidaea]